jgi:hypothetical protein
MANIGSGTSRVIVDPDGEAATVTSNRLDVNATIQAGDLNVGNVDIHLNGGVPLLGNAGAVASGVLRVTLASDDPAVAKLGTIDTDTGNIATNTSTIAGAVDGSEMQVDIVSSATLSVNSHAVTNGGTFVVQEDGAALTALQLIDDAIYVDDADFTLNSNKGIAIMGYSGNNTITAGDIGVIALTDTGNVRTVSNLGSTDTFNMIDVDNAAEQLSATIGVLTDCIEMFLQADESNSGYVIVGDSDVADNRGMKLNAGDTLILNADDTRGVYLWGSAANQNVRCMLSRF